MSKERTLLQKNSVLHLTRMITSEPRVFRIGDLRGEPGGSSACYEAKMIYGDGLRKPGTLKEFYPAPDVVVPELLCDLVRTSDTDEQKNCQLRVNGFSTRSNFFRLRDDFVTAYEIIEKAKQNNKDLYSPIPNFELFKSIAPEDDPDNYTVYVWIPYDIELVTFSDFLTDVCADTAENEKKIRNLRLILESIRSLTECIKALHMAKLRHLDITPANFGLRLINGSPSGNISLFDINTVYSEKDGRAMVGMGTRGFRSPDMLRGCVSQKCDFFSIGACLYYALVMEKNEKGELENRCFISPELDCAERIGQLSMDARLETIDAELAVSPLFNDCDFNENSEIRSRLAQILKKCFAVGTSRFRPYSGASALIRDLDEVISQWNGFESVSNSGLSEIVPSLVYEKKEELAEKSVKFGAEGAIQWLLYERPLYNYTDENKRLRILALGGGSYVSRFADIAFQLMQTDGCFTEITVASKDSFADKKVFLGKRPEFGNYFEVSWIDEDGQVISEKASVVPSDPYGRINFVPIAPENIFSADDRAHNLTAIRKICAFKDMPDDYSYVFIALHNDALNYEVAGAAAEVFESAQINFIVYGDKYADSNRSVVDRQTVLSDRIHAVDINMTVNRHPDYGYLRNMAFNVHLTWNGGPEKIVEARRSFRQRYNRSSSLANALSIKYKLHGIGVELNVQKPVVTAREFEKKIRGGKNQALLDRLIMFEHRRWNVEMICKGYTCLPPAEYDVLRTATKDEIKLRHPCLVPSGAHCGLLDDKWTKDGNAGWNTAGADDIAALDDELDTMSVLLHRHFCKVVKESKDEIRRNITVRLEKIARMIRGIKPLTDSFRSYATSVLAVIYEHHENDIDIGSLRYYRSGFRLALARSKDTAGDKLIGDTEKLVDEIDTELFPVLQSRAHTIWKLKDRELIENIPFILTYNSHIRLLIPMILQKRRQINTSGLFNNVASTFMLNPAAVTYVVDGRELASDFDAFCGALRYSINLISRHGLQTSVSILVLQPVEFGLLSDRTIREIRSISDTVAYVDQKPVEYNNVHACLENYLRDNEKSHQRITAIENNDTKISGYLNGCVRGDLSSFPSFTFNSEMQEFITDDETAFFSYIPFKPSLRVDDLFVSKDMSVSFIEPELQSHYMFFWNMYKRKPGDRTAEIGSSRTWKKLTAALREHCNDQLMTLRLPSFGKGLPDNLMNCEVRAFLPAKCKDGIEIITDALVSEGLICGICDDDRVTEYYSSSLLRVGLRTAEGIAAELRRLFADPDIFVDSDSLSVQKGGDLMFFRYDNTRVEGLLLDASADKDCIEILTKAAEEGYLLGYKKPMQSNDRISFTFASRGIKHLLTNEGNLFELYLYYKAISGGLFDDVKTSCTVTWNKDMLSNEFDVIATKGFRTYIFECKACEEIKQEMYNKLFALSNTFGVNNTTVLAIDLCGKCAGLNGAQAERGAEYGIVTVSAMDEISDLNGSGGIRAVFKRLIDKTGSDNHNSRFLQSNDLTK